MVLERSNKAQMPKLPLTVECITSTIRAFFTLECREISVYFCHMRYDPEYLRLFRLHMLKISAVTADICSLVPIYLPYCLMYSCLLREGSSRLDFTCSD